MARTLVMVFVLAIGLPFACTVAGVEGGDAAAENRTLAPPPHWNGTAASAVAYLGALGRWFDDHFAFRSTLVRWDASARLFVLGQSPSTVAIKGSDGWLYFAADGAVEDYANASLMTAEDVNLWRETLMRTNDWLHGRRVAYLFMLAPDKPVIYPEHMPATIRRIQATSRMDQVYAALAGTEVSTVDVRPALFAAKGSGRLYHLTDTHWNDRGALVAYQQLAGAIRRLVPATPPAWSQGDFEPVERDVPGMDVARMMGLSAVVREPNLQLVPRRPRRARVVEPSGAQSREPAGRLVTEVPDATLPRAVIFRDSFTTGLVPFLSEHFSRAVYLWQDDFDADVVVAEHPDIVIQQIVGRHLYTFIPSPELIPPASPAPPALPARSVPHAQ